MLHKFLVFMLLTSSICIGVNAQRGGRLGIVTGAASIQMVNADDNAADKTKLKSIATLGWQRGVELGYTWRYFGLSLQVMNSQFGQKYMIGSNFAQTKLNYTRPTLLFNFTSNPRNDIRFSGFLGGALGFLNSYSDVSQTVNPITGMLTTTTYSNKTFTINDTGKLNGTLSDGVYFKTDNSLVVGLGAEFRFSERWLVAVHGRLDYGIEKLENYDNLKLKYSIGNQDYSKDYQHWRGKPSKYEYSPFYSGVRKPSSNLAYGMYVSIKYIIPSQHILEYEMNGY
jgi:Outer membrane protein beta-barrel domain